MTHIHISNRSDLAALKSNLQMILPYVQILTPVCKHLLVTSVRAAYWELQDLHLQTVPQVVSIEKSLPPVQEPTYLFQ